MPALEMPDDLEQREFVLAYWNPIYLYYCVAMGRADPTDQLVADARIWPHDKMTGFLNWMAAQYTAWGEQNDIMMPDPQDTGAAQVHFKVYRKQFATWLREHWLPEQPHLEVRN